MVLVVDGVIVLYWSTYNMVVGHSIVGAVAGVCVFDQRLVFGGKHATHTTNGVEEYGIPPQFVGLVFDTVVGSPSPPGTVGSGVIVSQLSQPRNSQPRMDNTLTLVTRNIPYHRNTERPCCNNNNNQGPLSYYTVPRS